LKAVLRQAAVSIASYEKQPFTMLLYHFRPYRCAPRHWV